MPFDSGSVSYARFRVTGGPAAVDRSVLDALAAHAIAPPAAGLAPEVQAGFAGPRHVFDTDFDPDAVAFGDALLLGMRLDTNRLPAELVRAYRAIAERTRAEAGVTGFASKNEKRQAKDEADNRCRRELASGRHVRSKLIPILWNVTNRLLLAPVFTDATSTALRDLFDATFEASLEPLSSGALAREILMARGSMRDYEDMTPSLFTPPPAAAHSDDGRDVNTPAVPWSLAGPEPKDFLGNEFLLWLWARSELDSAVIETRRGGVAVAIDRALDLDCAWDATGRMTMRADAPTRLPEPARALAIGKWPRKAGLIVSASGEQWELTFQADRFLITGCKIPRPEEPPASPREAVEARIASVEALDRAMTDLFGAFLKLRAGSSWPAQRGRIRQWIAARAAGRAAATVEAKPQATKEAPVTV